MKVLVINDIHIGSEYCDDNLASQKLDLLSPNKELVTILNGDIVDMSACKKKDVTKLREYQLSLQSKWLSFYVRGNHDLIPNQNSFKVIGRTVFTHGHLVGNYKRVSKWSKYEYKKAGAGFLKQLWVNLADDMDWIKGKKPLPEDIIEAAVKLAKDLNCLEIVLGHYHPLKELVYIREGVTVRCLPKGFNKIEIIGFGE